MNKLTMTVEANIVKSVSRIAAYCKSAEYIAETKEFFLVFINEQNKKAFCENMLKERGD